jgi:predicted DNA-binding transcriptional regulator AlpA
MGQINGWITSGEACERLEIAWRTLYNLHRQSPDFPKPNKIGRTLLWARNRILASVVRS